jgi:ferredoxin
MNRKLRGTFTPPAAHFARLPEVSGNAVNGVGEDAPRRPTPIFWHKPEIEAHGALQEAIVAHFNAQPGLRKIYWDLAARGPKDLPPVAARAQARAPADWSAALKTFALGHDAELVGIARLDPLWVFEGYPLPELPWLVLVARAMEHARIDQAPATPENLEGAAVVAEEYNNTTRAARLLAAWLREQGYQSEAHGGPWAGPVNLLPAAIACGFGELGKHGSLINRRLGASFRIASVLTDMPLLADAPDTFGADAFCTNCKVCVDSCPPDAIYDDKQRVRGITKWTVDFDRCIPYFDATFGCGICVAVCPWSAPGRAPVLAERWTRRIANKPQNDQGG